MVSQEAWQAATVTMVGIDLGLGYLGYALHAVSRGDAITFGVASALCIGAAFHNTLKSVMRPSDK